MVNPGSNLLKRASKRIRFQDAELSRWTGSTKTAGVSVPVYAAAETIKGSPQAVSRAMYELFGLDLQKEYLMFYTSTVLRDLRRDATPDRLDFAGDRYTVESNTDWYAMDGWRGSLLVKVKATPA